MPPVSLPPSPFSFSYTPPATAPEAAYGHPNTPDSVEAFSNDPDSHVIELKMLEEVTIETADLVLDIHPDLAKETSHSSSERSPAIEQSEMNSPPLLDWMDVNSLSAELLGAAYQTSANPFSSETPEIVLKEIQGQVPQRAGHHHHEYHVKVATSCQQEDFLGYFFNYIKLQNEKPPGYSLTKFQWAFYFVSGLSDNELREHLLELRPASLMDVFRHYHRFTIKRDIDRYLTTPRKANGHPGNE